MSEALDSLSSLNHTTAMKAWGLVPKAEDDAETLNNLFDQLEQVITSSVAFSQALQATQTEAKNLAFLIDGCTTTDKCIDNSVWNECYRRQHVSSSGSAAVLSSGSLNPACFGLDGNFHGCPCCSNCSTMVESIQITGSNVLLNWTALDNQIPKKVVRSVFHAAAYGTRKSLENSKLFVNEVCGVFWYFKILAINAQHITGVLCSIVWAPGCLVSVTFSVGMYMTLHKNRGGCRNIGTIGQRLISTVFAIGRVNYG